MAIQFVDEDFVVVRRQAEGSASRLVTLAFGDAVEVLGQENGWTRVRVAGYFDGRRTGFIKGTPPLRDQGVLKLSMVDVQQGDGLVLETPAGKIMFIDGGDNKLFARHVAQRFRHRQSAEATPLEVDAIVVTHGDADHFDGLNEIVASETLEGEKARKRLFLHPRRVFHNGLVKGPTKSGQTTIPDDRQLGRTRKVDGWPFIVDLFDDPRETAPEKMNGPFKRWAATLNHWETRGPIALKRIAHGMSEPAVFDFLAEEGIVVELHGPFEEEVPGAGGAPQPALRFLRKPPRSAAIHLEQGDEGEGRPSASHTINGHSVAFRLTFGAVRINFTGDLNQESMARMLDRLPAGALEAEIVKVPHHGSHEFDLRALEAMKPVVAIVSSGDESAAKEYIHPRATLMAAAGHAMRGQTGLLLCTELAAFFTVRDLAYTQDALARYFRANNTKSFTGDRLAKLVTGGEAAEGFPKPFFAFERTNFGIIHVRTDGERVLVFTHSGKAGLNEAYRFTVTKANGLRTVTFAPQVTTR